MISVVKQVHYDCRLQILSARFLLFPDSQPYKIGLKSPINTGTKFSSSNVKDPIWIWERQDIRSVLGHYLNPFTTKYLNAYVVSSAEYFNENHNDPMFNILNDILFFVNWCGKLYLFGRQYLNHSLGVISLVLEICRYLKHYNEALKEYILIMPTKLTYST